MTETNNQPTAIPDLEAPDAEDIKGGLSVADEQNEEDGRKPTGVTVKIRKPGK